MFLPFFPCGIDILSWYSIWWHLRMRTFASILHQLAYGLGYQTAYASRVHKFMLNHGQNISSVSLKFSQHLTFRVCL